MKRFFGRLMCWLFKCKVETFTTQIRFGFKIYRCPRCGSEYRPKQKRR